MDNSLNDNFNNNFNNNFSNDEEIIKDVNNEDINNEDMKTSPIIPSSNSNVILYITVGVILFLVALWIFFVYFTKNKTKENSLLNIMKDDKMQIKSKSDKIINL